VSDWGGGEIGDSLSIIEKGWNGEMFEALQDGNDHTRSYRTEYIQYYENTLYRKFNSSQLQAVRELVVNRASELLNCSDLIPLGPLLSAISLRYTAESCPLLSLST
jgi:hypothetical protein